MRLLALGGAMLILSIVLIAIPYTLTEYRVDAVNVEVTVTDEKIFKPVENLLRLPEGYKELVDINLTVKSLCFSESVVVVHYSIYERMAEALYPNESISLSIKDLSNFIEINAPRGCRFALDGRVEYYLNRYIWLFLPAFIVGVVGGLILLRYIAHQARKRLEA